MVALMINSGKGMGLRTCRFKFAILAVIEKLAGQQSRCHHLTHTNEGTCFEVLTSTIVSATVHELPTLAVKSRDAGR